MQETKFTKQEIEKVLRESYGLQHPDVINGMTDRLSTLLKAEDEVEIKATQQAERKQHLITNNNSTKQLASKKIAENEKSTYWEMLNTEQQLELLHQQIEQPNNFNLTPEQFYVDSCNQD